MYPFFYKENNITNFILSNQSLFIFTSASMHYALDKSRKKMDAFQLIYYRNCSTVVLMLYNLHKLI